MSFDSVTSQHDPDHLIVGEYPDVRTGETVLSGETLVRGTVVGKVTASGKLITFDTAGVDGSEIPYGVLMEGVDASAADKVGPVATSGKFNIDALIVGGTTDLTTDAVQLLMRTANLYTESVIDAQARVSD
jgi:hypothetical protein